jgi:hypothetical protein
MGMPLESLLELLKRCETWISVDNFFPHLANLQKKAGYVIWGQSDPKIFGYAYNNNLLKDRLFLREKQFDIWECVEYREDVFLTPEEIVKKGFTHEFIS